MTATKQYYMYAEVSAGEYDYEVHEAIIEFDMLGEDIIFYSVYDEKTNIILRDSLLFCINPEEMMEPYRNYTDDIESFILANKKDWRE